MVEASPQHDNSSPDPDGPFLEYEKLLTKEFREVDQTECCLCYTVVARGFSVAKLVACDLYENYSGPSPEDAHTVRTCSPYLIFILNFDEVDNRALELNL